MTSLPLPPPALTEDASACPAEPKGTWQMYEEYKAALLKQRGYTKEFFERLDPGIRRAVRVLAENGIETFESCEGSEGHCFFEPTVRFHGSQSDGWRALTIAQEHGLRVLQLNRYWSVEDGEPVGPSWELVFRPCFGLREDGDDLNPALKVYEKERNRKRRAGDGQ